MDDTGSLQRSVELLQQLGLKEYEARSFVALSRQPSGTAKDVSELSEVPRTRVYDAIRVLESKGLVETQHSTPKRFRAVSVDEAVTTFHSEYEERTETLREALQNLDRADDGGRNEITHEIWTLSGEAAIRNRVHQFLDDAEEEVVLVIGDPSVFDPDLAARLQEAVERGVRVVVGAPDEEIRDRIGEILPGVEPFVSGLEWIHHSAHPDDDTVIGRLLLVDEEAILVSSFDAAADGRRAERAVVGRGFENGVVTLARRLMAMGLPGGLN